MPTSETPESPREVQQLMERWSATANWRMRKELATLATNIRDDFNVIAEYGEYETDTVVEALSDIQQGIRQWNKLHYILFPELGTETPDQVHAKDLSARLARLSAYLRRVMVDQHGQPTPQWKHAEQLLNGVEL